MNQDYPRILILSSSFKDGDAISILNFFNGWPEESMYCISVVGRENAKHFKEMYLLGNKECQPMPPFNLFERIPTSEIVIATNFAKSDEKFLYRSSNSLKRKMYEKVLRPFMQLLDFYDSRIKFHLSDQLAEWIDRVKPDIIYSSVGSLEMGKLMLAINKRFPSIPFVIHGFDDWITPTSSNLFRSRHIRKAERILKDNLDIASLHLSTTDKMSLEYNLRYGKSFTAFYNPTTLPKCNVNSSQIEHDVTYVGKIWLHNSEAIKDFIEALSEYNQKGKKAVLNIYTGTPVHTLADLGIVNSECVIIHPSVNNSEVPSILSTSGALLLPISINKAAAAFAKYSMSTKMGEYMASKRPVIYYGPENIAMTELIRKEKTAFCVTNKKTKVLAKIIETALDHTEDCKQMIDNAFELAKDKFDKEVVSKRFQTLLLKLVSENTKI